MKRWVAALLVFLTGGAALIYELAWTRWLTLTLGASARSLAVVTASTMLGFGVGAGLLGRRVDRTARPLRMYGLLELAIGLSAAAVTAVLRAAPMARWSADLPHWAVSLVVLALVGIPTAFMGVTIPALVAHLGRGDAAATRGAFGTLYAANTAGAVLGTLAAGFLLIERLGYTGASSVGIALNVLVGAFAVLSDRGEAAPAAPAEGEETPAAVHDPKVARSALIAATVSGFGVMAHEVISSRLLVYGFFATTHAIAIILAVFLGGLSLGARIVAGPMRRGTVGVVHLGGALVASGALSLALAPSLTQTAALVDALRGTRPEWSVRLGIEALVASAVLLPAAVVMGLVFPLAAGLYASARSPGATLGRAVLGNTMAGVAGALGAGFVLVPLFGVRGSIAVVALVQAASGAWIVAAHATARRAAVAAIATAFAVAAGGALWAQKPRTGGVPGETTLVAQHVVGHEEEYRVLCYREGPTAITEVLAHGPSGRRDVLIDGFVAAGNDGSAGYMDLMGRVPMTLHPSPRRALVICFGTGATARAVASFPGASVDLVDINPDVFACAPSFPANVPLLRRARVHVEDGRAFLRRSSGERYDVITQEPMPPHFAGVAALYSEEYYRLARARLADDGVMVQWLPMHLTAPDDARQIAAAALRVFPETWLAIAPGDYTGLLVSSPRPIPAGRRAAVERELATAFALDPAHLRRFIDGAGPTTDDRPSLEYNGVDRVLSRFRSPSRMLRYNLQRVVAAGR